MGKVAGYQQVKVTKGKHAGLAGVVVDITEQDKTGKVKVKLDLDGKEHMLPADDLQILGG